MASGMWSAVSGASSQAHVLDVVANNLANVDTPAFKKSIPTFKEYLAELETLQTPEDVPRKMIKDQDLYPLHGRDVSHVVLDGTHLHFAQGSLRQTHHPFDMALEGPGFFKVQTVAGIRLTRQGSFKVNQDGIWVTSAGHPVLSKDSKPIQFSENTPNDLMAQFGLVEVKDLKKLKSMGHGLYVGSDKDWGEATNTVVHSGVLEASNVNPIEEMTRMIQANRLFETDLKAMKTYHEILGKEANEVGKL